VLSEEVRAHLARLLEQRGMSGRQLARETGIPQPSLSRKLRGAAPLDVDDLEAIAGALGIPVADLVTPPGDDS
jgi:transcriptional regulator with XRE-family HTH domain